jgi:hypothetical protein
MVAKIFRLFILLVEHALPYLQPADAGAGCFLSRSRPLPSLCLHGVSHSAFFSPVFVVVIVFFNRCSSQLLS